jgi:DNA repair protein RadC
LIYRYRPKTDDDGALIHVPRPVLSADAIALALSRILADEAVEVFGIVCLTTRRTVIGWHEVSRGGLNGASVRIADVFKPAILANAAAIIVAHNHPSGDPTPSEPDLRLTRRLSRVGKQIEIDVLDHLIVGRGRFISLRSLRDSARRLSLARRSPRGAIAINAGLGIGIDIGFPEPPLRST